MLTEYLTKPIMCTVTNI